MDIGDVRGLYHPDYNPYQAMNDLVKGGYTMSTSGIFYELDSQNTALVQMEKAFAIDGRRLWMMCPGLLEYLGRRAKWDIEFAYDICGQVLSAFQMRTTTSSSIWLPDGSKYYPGAAIPPCEMLTEELQFSDRHAYLVESECLGIVDELFLQGPKGDIQQSQPEASSQADAQNQSGGMLNFGSHRKGILFSHDARNIKLLSDEAALEIPGSNSNAQKAIRALVSQPLTQQQAERSGQQEQKAKVSHSRHRQSSGLSFE